MTERGFIDVNVQLGPVPVAARGAPLETRRRASVTATASGCRSSATGRPCSARRASATGCSSRRSRERPGLRAGGGPVGRSDRGGRHGRAARPGRSPAFWLEGKAAPGSGLSAEPVVRAAARTGRPLLVPISGWGSASAIGAATEGLGVPVMLTGSHYTTSVEDVAAGRRYEHLHFDTSGMAHFRAIETFVAAVGAERVLFGSGSPLRAHPVVDQRDPRREHPGRREAGDPGRQRGPHLRPAGGRHRAAGTRPARPRLRHPHARRPDAVGRAVPGR